jgi:hypothetical protein
MAISPFFHVMTFFLMFYEMTFYRTTAPPPVSSLFPVNPEEGQPRRPQPKNDKRSGRYEGAYRP